VNTAALGVKYRAIEPFVDELLAALKGYQAIWRQYLGAK